MFELSETKFLSISIHRIHQPVGDKSIIYSDQPIPMLHHTDLNAGLKKMLLSPFSKYVGYHKFKHPLDDQPIFQLARSIFDHPDKLHENSKKVVDYLFRQSHHHAIKGGDLIMVHFKEVLFEDEVISAIGIFKLELIKSLLNIDFIESSPKLSMPTGYDIGKLDKGCMIYQTDNYENYMVAVVDRTNKDDIAGFWYNDFLNLEPMDDAYYQTQQYINMTQSYLVNQISEDADIRRGDQVAMLHDANQYFSNSPSYNQREFENEVLGQNPELIQSFQDYKRQYEQEMDLDNPLPEQFSLSQLAIRKGVKDFKSVLKLDKNFHIYIHGDRNLIEHGTDAMGRKYYKLFYENEA